MEKQTAALKITKQPSPFSGEDVAENGDIIRFNGSELDSNLVNLNIQVIDSGENGITKKAINLNIGDGSNAIEAMAELSQIVKYIQYNI